MITFQHTAARRRLAGCIRLSLPLPRFNTQPPEGGWLFHLKAKVIQKKVSTHSRPKAAGSKLGLEYRFSQVSTHSRPKAAGYIFVSDNQTGRFQHTAARRRLVTVAKTYITKVMRFQHTAARRRLGSRACNGHSLATVSTHSRPKAAGLLGF